MTALTIATLAAALAIAAPAPAAPDAPPDIVLLCEPQKPGGPDMRDDGRRVGHIDRDTGVYEEMTYVGDTKTETLGFGKCVESTKQRKF